ncbi:MAG TPA: hypothetical protein VGL51_02365 [Solirubrobacteraceae bacterium]|jgi:alpha-1,6-mannosyltransferase
MLDRRAAAPVLELAPGPQAALRVVDVAMFFGERSGGIRTYLEAKADFARRTGWLEHRWPPADSVSPPC